MKKMSAEQKLNWYRQSIEAGGSVRVGNRIVTRVEDLPTLGVLATTDAERTAALDDLAVRRRALELEEERLRGLAASGTDETSGGKDGGQKPPLDNGQTGGEKSDALPQNFPGRKTFIDAGYTTVSAVNSLTAEELRSLAPAVADKVLAMRQK